MSSPSKRIIVIGWDGLRPDLITPDVTPFLYKMAAQGVQAQRHFAAYPTETRVNAATLSTGCWPGRHGIVGNEFYWPAFGSRPINTGNFDDLSRLRSLGPITLVPSLAQRLLAADKGMAVLSAGSPGSALMWDPTQVGPVLNVWVDFGDPRTREMRLALGKAPNRQTPNSPANRYIVRALIDLLLPRRDIAVCILWLTEPDHSQHERGLGSPEALQALRDNDVLVSEVVGAVDRRGETDCTDFIIVSDHGFSTIERADKELAHMIAEDHIFAPSDNPIEAVASYGVYLHPGADPIMVAERFRQTKWCGTILSRRSDDNAGLLPLSAAWGGHLNERAPDLTVSPVWDALPNEFGIPGRTAFGSHIANHGSLSPFDLRSVFLANGPSFKRRFVSSLTCGAVDLAPSILHILGVPSGDPAMDGRPLTELLINGEAPPASSRRVLRATVGSETRQLQIDRVGSTEYMVGEVSE
jgi:predicted AlkP superfamily pyrophosphatase or phosphodiesterase